MSQFLLEGLTDTEGLRPLLFAIFLLVYIVAAVGNLGIVSLIVMDSRLHTPMYFFLGNLSLLDTAYVSSTLPQVLVHLLASVWTMSYRACLTQIFLLHFLAPWECFLLTAMSYDRYAAICQPLPYLVLMGRRTRTGLASISCLLALANALTHTTLAALLKFCGPRLITHFFCDLPPLLKLSCSSTQANELALFFFSFLVALAPCTLVVISYIYTLWLLFSGFTVLRAEGKPLPPVVFTSLWSVCSLSLQCSAMSFPAPHTRACETRCSLRCMWSSLPCSTPSSTACETRR